MIEELEENLTAGPNTLESWVVGKVSDWSNNYDSNYQEKFKEYRRIFCGVYDANDKQRESERSQLMSPATTQAVESSVSEIEEATFGRGEFFDIRDDIKFIQPPEQPEGELDEQQAQMLQQQAQQFQAILQRQIQEKLKIQFLKQKLSEDFSRAQIRSQVGEVLLNGAIYGTGIAEVVLENEIDVTIEAMEDTANPGQMINGEMEVEKPIVRLKPVLPQNFRIDPAATSIKDALGVAIVENVSPHQIIKLQEEGVYQKGELGIVTTSQTDLAKNPNLTTQPNDVVKLTKYYGLVPRKLLNAAQNVAELSELESLFENPKDEDLSEEQEALEGDLLGEEEVDDGPMYMEACVVVANDTTILKAIPNPYMYKERPVLAFQWDKDPGEFWGRGIVEKAIGPQRALDTEMRARIDNLALQNSPAIGIDATRIPRGEDKKTISPGKTFLTNGDPRTVLHPFSFNAVNANTFQQTQNLNEMISQATGAVDSAGFPGSINQQTAAGASMGLGAIIKRQKRTLVNFQEQFLIPFVKTAACRYQKFDSQNYPIQDFTFIATSTLGVLAREYETTQLVQLLQTMPQDNPVYMLLVQGVVDNMQLKNREDVMEAINSTMQPDPQQAEMAQAQAQANMQFQLGQTAALFEQAAESKARAKKIATETKAIPVELENDRIGKVAALQRADGEMTRDDKMAIAMAKTTIDEKKLTIDEEKMAVQR